MQRPLSGIKVLDFTWMMAGPYCTRFLADLGAEVIKVEAPEGEIVRSRAPMRGGRSAFFGMLNCGKQSVALDLKNPAAADAARRLASQCDIVVESFRPGVMQRLRLDFQTLHGADPRLIYCSVSGYGQNGPNSARPAFAQVVQAKSGHDVLQALYQGDAGKLPNTGIYPADVLAGAFALSGILAALRHRDITGLGQHVDTTLFESMLCLMPHQLADAQFDIPVQRPVYEPIATQDGFLMVAAISEKNFRGLLDVVKPGWSESEPDLASEAARHINWPHAMSYVSQWARERKALACEQALADAGVPAASYATVADALHDPQVHYRKFMAPVHDQSGNYLTPSLPFSLSSLSLQPEPEVAELGAHTERLLRELAGMDINSIRAATSIQPASARNNHREST